MEHKFIITVQRIERGKLMDKAEFEIPDDSCIDDFRYIFGAILAHISFDFDQIKEFFNGGINDEEIDGN